ncbi:hypothetical protein GOP47_0017728 [Adiantum capillus-veneris]|uniref:Amidohydrolase 3 domain-containing protein n=1 Tax=Adiantum capillus-veneris TaxID=13818 RepID=A0A9D4UG69_ADICA|nr:hypothetical protein GOP47_0017728 [Adiantum capillus-veneris]
MELSWRVILVSLSLCLAIILRRPPLSREGVADIVFKNATIYTGDPQNAWAKAIAIRKGRIIEIGSYDIVQTNIGPNTRYEDLHGSFVVPGFIDSHVHVISGGLQMLQVNLQDVSSQIDFVKQVQLAVQGVEGGHWLLGGGWNNEKWGGELPSVSWIDSFTEEVPVWIYRMDGHMGLANSRALQLSGIPENIADPEGGSFIRSKDGSLTGVLVDSAMKSVIDCIPEPTTQERRDALTRASKLALSNGITTVVDLGRYFPGSPTTRVWNDYHDVYKWADQTGSLLIRLSIFFPLETWSDVYMEVKQTGKRLSQNLILGGLKSFADGSLGSGTALFNEPYADDPSNYGLEISSPEAIMNHVLEADRRGLQIAIHAIGDAANDRVISLYQAVNRLNGQRDRRLRIEHAQHLSQNALEIFGAEGIIASMQPQHLLDDASFASKKLGEERALKESYLFKSLLTRNTTLAFGSDWPVVHLNPLQGILAATKRKPTGWKNSWIPAECIDVEAALQGYTLAAAYASFLDDEIGSLSRGKYADFVVLSGDVFHDDGEVGVLATYKGGIRVFSREVE